MKPRWGFKCYSLKNEAFSWLDYKNSSDKRLSSNRHNTSPLQPSKTSVHMDGTGTRFIPQWWKVEHTSGRTSYLHRYIKIRKTYLRLRPDWAYLLKHFWIAGSPMIVISYGYFSPMHTNRTQITTLKSWNPWQNEIFLTIPQESDFNTEAKKVCCYRGDINPQDPSFSEQKWTNHWKGLHGHTNNKSIEIQHKKSNKSRNLRI